MQSYTALHTDWLHLPLNLRLITFPNDVVSMHNVLFKFLLDPWVKCWDLSLLLSFTQMPYPNQCSCVGVYHQQLFFKSCTLAKLDKSEFQIQWILTQRLEPLMSRTCVCLCKVPEEEDKAARRICICHDVNSRRNEHFHFSLVFTRLPQFRKCAPCLNVILILYQRLQK